MFPKCWNVWNYKPFGKAAVTGGFLTKVGTMTSVIGASLVLNGISTMLTPVETIPEEIKTQEDHLILVAYKIRVGLVSQFRLYMVVLLLVL